MAGVPRYRLLLVEDNPRDARFLELLLAGEASVEFHMEHVERLEAAVARLAAGDVDAVVLDLSLPDSHGLATFERLQAAAPTVPVVVLSGNEDEQLALNAVQAGAQDYLVKGRDVETLLIRTIRYAIERARVVERLRQHDEFMRLLTRQLPCVFWTTDLELRFTAAAGAEEAALSLRTACEQGRTARDYFQSEGNGVRAVAAHQAAVRGGSDTFDMHWKDRIYHLHIEPFRAASGQVIGALGVALDVTDQTMVQLELRIARQVQEGLRPGQAPQVEGYELGGNSVAAEAAGGDFYDYIEFDDATPGVAIGDVGGHGLGPAMVMCHTRAYLRALAKMQHDVTAVLALANRLLAGEYLEPRLLVAAMLVKLSPNHRVHYAAAGHRGYWLHADGRNELLDHTGVPLNVAAENMLTTTRCVQMHSGDIVLLYTDGIYEARNDSEPFGIERMLAHVNEHRREPAQQIVDGLFDAVRAHAPLAHKQDDMTAVVIKIV